MEKYGKIEKLVPDTSVIIEGLVSKKIEKNEIQPAIVVIHEAVVAELEHQANLNKATGFLGLDELNKLKKISSEFDFRIEFAGKKPSAAEIKYAKLGEIDSMIRDLAYEEDATLFTADKVQARIAETKNIKFIFFELERIAKKIKLESFFDNTTMSVHLRENVLPYAKKGMPGNWQFVAVKKKKLAQEEIQDISKEIIEEAGIRRDGFIEIERPGSTIVQLGKYRIVITKPPFSDGWEITAVKPVKKLTLEDYKLSEKLKSRVETAEGILIAGAPGMGKCLAGKEIVYTSNFMPITAEDIYNSNHRVIYSINKNGVTEETKITAKSKRKERGIYTIQTRTGRSVRLTAEHPLLLFDGKEMRWVAAKSIRVGDKIAAVKNVKVNPDDSLEVLSLYSPCNTLCKIEGLNKRLPIYYRFIKTERELIKFLFLNKEFTIKDIAKFCKLSVSHTKNLILKFRKQGFVKKAEENIVITKRLFNLNEHPYLLLEDIKKLRIDDKFISTISAINQNKKYSFIKLPRGVTPELCRFLGYIYAEGGGEKLSFTNTNTALVADFKYCAKEVFGISEWKMFNRAVYVDWKESIAPILINLGYPLKKRKKSRIMKLPQFLFRCSISNLKNFLQAYFDCDGGTEKRNSINYYTSSNQAAHQISTLLLRLGILSTLRSKFRAGAERYTISIIDPESIRKFAGEICPISEDKKKSVIECSDKGYEQTFTYNLKTLLRGIKWKERFSHPENISLKRCTKILEGLYEDYFSFCSKNEGLLLILEEYIDKINYMKFRFKGERSKLTYSRLRKNNIDHNCLRKWEKGRQMRLTTLNKVSSILGLGVFVAPEEISKIIAGCISSLNTSVNYVANGNGINQSTMSLRLKDGWTSLKELKEIHYFLSEELLHKKKELEQVISVLEMLVKKDIVFDRVKRVSFDDKEEEVFDFETENHNYLCGKIPILVHNSTFAQGLAEYYASKNKIVKTVEAPRDLVLPDNVTQYAISHGDAQEIHDILLLSRPDNTIFDEMRNTKDFQLYADLRLSGVGMAGVVHATSPIDAIQRFVGRIELGVIPQVIDTVIFIKNGAIERVLSLKMTVKVPSGMTEADLARPVVVVTDFETGKLEYELYSYGEETVVVPVSGKEKSPSNALAARAIEDEFKNYTNNVKVDVISGNKAVVYVPSTDISKIIGRQGRTIEEIEKRLGISIDVQELKGREVKEKGGKEIPFEAFITKKAVVFECKGLKNTEVDIYLNDEFILSAKTGKTGVIKINKKHKIGQILITAINRRENIRLLA